MHDLLDAFHFREVVKRLRPREKYYTVIWSADVRYLIYLARRADIGRSVKLFTPRIIVYVFLNNYEK